MYGSDGTQLTIVGGEMSGTYGNEPASKCFDGDDATLCHSSSAPWWASFDLGSSQCVESIAVINRNDQFKTRLVGSEIRLSPCSIKTCSRRSWSSTFATAELSYDLQLPLPANMDSKPELAYLRLGDLPDRDEEAAFQANNHQLSLEQLPTAMSWTYYSKKFVAGFKYGKPITDMPTHKIDLSWNVIPGHPKTHAWGDLYLDDVSIQLA